MKNLLLFICCLSCASALWSQHEPQVQGPPPPPESVQIEAPLNIVDEYAEFPGGKAAMNKYLSTNIKYPKSAVKNKREGKCYIRFVVDTNGDVSGVTVMKGVPDCPECDDEAARVVSMMPQWKPGKYKGKTVSSYYNLPIYFAL